ncbi:hypothetical protein FQN57_002906 [Myotisia sp. PD_48]|nr:hypothetical protein FQN57_002906 [Myotisia sp. PD_48]
MPELAEVARIVYFIQKYLVGHTISKATAQHDDILFGKVGTSAVEFQKHMEGKKVVGAGQQGKYFWMVMSSPPHPVIHFGMTGWLKFRHINSYYRTNGKEEENQAEEIWPPKFWKFILETEDNPDIAAAFVDARRLGRVRLVDCPGDDIRNYSPLKENGPDPVADKAIFTEDWFTKTVQRKRVPIKAFLLDQANISGLGNWMCDEVLYHSKIHPEQYSNTLSDTQTKEIYSAINYVCSVSVDLRGASSQFPTDWLFHHRWNKGKKGASGTLPNGEPIVFVTVGGRTSAVVPGVQKKTGLVASEVKTKDEGDQGIGPKRTIKPAARKSRARAIEDGTPNSGTAPIKQQPGEEIIPTPRSRKRQNTTNATIYERVARVATPKKLKTAQKPTKTTVDGGIIQLPTPSMPKSAQKNSNLEVQVPLRRGRSASKK